MSEGKELWWDSTYAKLSTEEKAKVLELLHAYVVWLKFNSNTEFKWNVIWVFMWMLEELKK